MIYGHVDFLKPQLHRQAERGCTKGITFKCYVGAGKKQTDILLEVE